eukprot:gene7118-14477_t
MQKFADILRKYQPDLNNLQFGGSNQFKIMEYAIENTTLAVMRAILDYNPDNSEFKLNVNKFDPSPQSSTALTCAASRGNVHLVKLLISYGAIPDIVDNEKWTALHSAVEQKNSDIAKILLQRKVDPNQVATVYYSSQGYNLKNVSPLHVAVTSPNPMSMVSLLVAYGADINLKCQYIDIHDYAEDDDEPEGIYELSASELYSNYGKDKKKEIEFNNAVEEGRKMRNKMTAESDNKQTHIDDDDNVSNNTTGITEGLNSISSNYIKHEEDIEKVSIASTDEYNTTTTNSEHSSPESDNENKRLRLV